MVVLEGLRRFFSAQKLDLLVLLAELEHKDFSYLRRVVDRGLVDGVIIADIQFHDPRIDYLLPKQLPFVAYGRSQTAGRYSWIDFDFEGASAAAVERLVRQGHRRIVLGSVASDINYGSVVEVAFREASPGSVCRPVTHRSCASVTPSRAATSSATAGCSWTHAPRPPCSPASGWRSVSIGASRKPGSPPRRDLAVVAIVEEPNARFLRPQVTHFTVDLQGLGFRLGEALLQEMRDSSKPPVQELFPMRLSLGDSNSIRRIAQP